MEILSHLEIRFGYEEGDATTVNFRILIAHAPPRGRWAIMDRERGNSVEPKNDLRSYVISTVPFKLAQLLLCEQVPLALTLSIFACEVGRLPGFDGLVYFCLLEGWFGWPSSF